ncbi:hypothetical protein UFOVP513_14 [uncultured Caudovirales phage]|uniref:Uncharacterized protein n=1 Tax=uncultured Caudovirales phage TaxID=2100421 RepID=A0A6J5MMB4_9CAUD|nr:hypothetical protein UFOVP513_14 [uncultured Caudovirales phage]
MSQTLSGYITECRRLLHDANANFYSNPELTDYINQARQRLVRDTGCLRTYQTSATVTNQEVYTFASLPNAAFTMDILNINIIWGNSRIPLRYMPWTQFNAELRFWQNYYGRPIAFSMYGPTSFYISPVPDQVYVMELDTVILPTPLVTDAQVDEIPDPWTSPVAFYACYKAKFKEQSYGEAEIFKQEYTRQAQSVLATTYTRRMPSPYSSPY